MCIRDRSSTSGLSMTYFFIWKGPKDNLLESLSFLNSKNDRIKLTYVIDESRISFWIYFCTKMLILAHCSFLPIKSHQTNIFILFPRATRGPLLDLEVSLCAILEIVPRLKLLAIRVRNSGSVSRVARLPSWDFTTFIQGG